MRFDFLHFASVACVLIGKDGEYGKTHAKISDSVCNDLYSERYKCSAPTLFESIFFSETKKQSILCLKCNLLNTTFLFNCCYYKINIAFAHMLMFRKMTIWCSFRFLINYWTVANIISATLSNRIILIINQNHKTSQNSSNPLVIHCFLMFVLLISLQNDATSWKMMSARKWLLLVKGVLTKD